MIGRRGGILMACLALAAGVPQRAEAQGGAGTLFTWNTGNDVQGGPPGLDEPLASDRPDFTEASTTVGRGVAQLEFGYTYTYDESGADNSKNHSYPETLLRVGVLADWLEFRIAWNHAQSASITGGATSFQIGAEDIYVGAKLGLTPQDGLLPEMALMPQMLVPTGRGDDSDQVLPGVNWLYGWDVCDWLSTAGSSQINRVIDPDTRDAYVEFAQSWTVGYALTEQWGAYTEFFFLVPCSADTAHTESYFDGGFTYQFTHNLQADWRYGVGLNEAAADYFTGLGGVIRY